MRFFLITILFLILTLSSMAKTTTQLRLTGHVTWANQVSILQQNNQTWLEIISNATTQENIAITLEQNGKTITLTTRQQQKLVTQLASKSKKPILLTFSAL